jgi:Ca-activated chloride channel family protein
MSMIHFYNPAILGALWLIPIITGLFIYSSVKRQQAMNIFGAGTTIISRKREAVSSCMAAALIIIALARPAWDVQEQHLQETGRDVIFLLDVSRSMLAEDMHPNRLEHTKTAILDCVEALSGDRVGLVLFAGSAEIRCPLTVDYDYFRMALRQATPESVAVGGTMIAHAIEKVTDKLIDPDKAGLQDVILITDGEDMIDGADEIEAARTLSTSGARLIAIGIGDRSRGSRILVEDEETGVLTFMKYNNREIWTKLHSETLRKMSAAVTDGTYFEVANGPFDLKKIYQQVMEHAQRTSVESQVRESYEEKFHLFLGGAVLILLLSNRWKVRAVHLIAGLLFFAGLSHANPSKLFREGNKAYTAGKYADAVDAYRAATLDAPESAEIYYNLGNAQYRVAHFEEAQGSFESAASLAQTDGMRSQCWYNLANCLVKSAEAVRESEPHAAVQYCRKAAWLYRTALEYNRIFADAAYNLEMTQRIAANIVEEIREQEEKEQQENELIKYLREKLEEFIERQSKLIEMNIKDTPQRVLETDTLALAKVMEDSGLHTDIVLPDGSTVSGPLKETYTHTLQAAEAMKTLDQETALSELIAALGSAPEDPDQQEDESDENSEDSDDYDMDYEESEEEAEMYEEADPFGDFSEYEEIRGVPPPNKTEMDILAEELQNQERRKEKKAGQYKAVEKDW